MVQETCIIKIQFKLLINFSCWLLNKIRIPKFSLPFSNFIYEWIIKIILINYSAIYKIYLQGCSASSSRPAFLVILTSSHKHLLHNLSGQFGTIKLFVKIVCVVLSPVLWAYSDRQLLCRIQCKNIHHIWSKVVETSVAYWIVPPWSSLFWSEHMQTEGEEARVEI